MDDETRNDKLQLPIRHHLRRPNSSGPRSHVISCRPGLGPDLRETTINKCFLSLPNLFY